MERKIQKVYPLIKFLLSPLIVLSAIAKSIWQNALSHFLPEWTTEFTKAHPIMTLVSGLGLSALTYCFIRLLEVKAELKSLRESEHDLPLGEAINRIQKMRRWKNVPDYEIRKVIEELAFEGKIVVWGIIGDGQLAEEPALDRLMTIPPEFFYGVNGGLTEGDGYSLEILSCKPGWSDWNHFRSFFHVTVNRDQINAIFSRMKPIKSGK